MVSFTTSLKKFGSQGEKTGWTYIEIPADLADKLYPGNRKAFRVKGKLDSHSIKYVALMPMGGGIFIMPVNAAMRKAIGKRHGAMISVSLQVDKSEYKIDKDFNSCLEDEPRARKYFDSLTRSHQNYFSKWIETAKTTETKAKRIAMAVNALARDMGFPEMLREKKGI